MMNNKIKYFLLVFLLIPFTFYSQNFKAELSSSEVVENEQFQLSFTFSGSDANDLTNYTPPSFRDFHVLSGPNHATSMQIINGSVSASKTLSYVLQPNKAGSFLIGSASIDHDGKRYSTDPIKLEVIKASSTPTQRQQKDYAISNEEIADNLFIKAAVDKQKVYQGEQITVTYKLYTRLSIASQMSVSKLPSYQGFWAEELQTSNTIMFTNENVNGKQFRVGVLKRVALFPSQTGELFVTPLELKIPVQLQKKKGSGNIFDDFFNDPFFSRGQTIEYTATSNRVKVNVTPLPEQNKPEAFNGAVGDFTINSQLDKTKGLTNEPLSLKVEISGTGNIQLLNIPEIKLPSGFDKFDPKTSEQVKRSNKVSGKKTIEYLIIPRTIGTKEIPPVKFSYFNPAKKSYVTLETKSYTINIKEGENLPGLAGIKENVRILGEDIRYIKTSSIDLSDKGEIVLFQFGFWAAAVIPFAALAGLIVWKKRDEKLTQNMQVFRYQRAEKIAKNRLKSAKKLMMQNNNPGFYSEISHALYGYLEDKFHIPKSEFSLERAVEELNKNEVDGDLINNLKVCAEKCEYARFAPQNNGSAAMNEMYNDSANIIIEIEKSLAVKNNVQNV